MDRSSLILKTIRELYDGVLEPKLGAQAFESLSKLVAGEHLLFFTEDLHANRLQFFAGLGVTQDFFRRLAMAAEAKIMPPGLLTMPSGSLKFAQDCWAQESFERTAFYNEVVRPEGGHYGLVAAPFRQNRYTAFLAIERLHGQAQSLCDGSFTSVKQLREHIDNFVDAYNADAKPFVWSKSEVHQKRLKARFADQ